MSADDFSLGDDALKQRRNLMVTSVLLIFIHFAGVEFGGSLVVFGATLRINNPEIIKPGIVFVLLYFAWRYYQYVKADGVVDKIKKDFKERYNGDARGFFVLVMKKYGTGEAGLRDTVSKPSYSQYKRERGFRYSAPYKIRMLSDPDSERTFYDNKRVAGIPFYSLYSRKVRFFLCYAFDSRVLTDYVVPFLMFLLALCLQAF